MILVAVVTLKKVIKTQELVVYNILKHSFGCFFFCLMTKAMPRTDRGYFNDTR